MRLLFKLLGFALIVLTTTAIGFLKSNSLNMRHKKLCSLKNAITDLKQRIRLSHGEIDKLIAVSFKDIPDFYSYLEKSDTQIVENFFKDIGMLDVKAECERCELYISLLDAQIIKAQKNYTELNKLYKSMGIMGGIFICIFFL